MKKTLSFQEKYEAYCRHDIDYEGLFLVAASNSNIFCHPTCNALSPKKENVFFYETTQEAIQHGFRPCEVCNPMEKMDDTPQYIQKMLKDLSQNPFLNIEDYDLKGRGIEPDQIRQWFKKNHNISFQTYQRMLRINTAFDRIDNDISIPDTALENGLPDSQHSIFGKSTFPPGQKPIINIVRFTTPIGSMFACASQQGICLLDFTDRKTLETEFKTLCKRFDAVILSGENPYLEQLQSELSEYFSGKRKVFTVPLHTTGTEFQQLAWEVLQDIPYGKSRSYKQQAIAIKNPKAIRAVASANSHNRISIIIPCHRVIGSDGKLVGYGGGLDRKQWLLEFERCHS